MNRRGMEHGSVVGLGVRIDLVGRAFAREHHAQRVLRWPMEYDSVFAHVFRCVCCGRMRGEEERREPRSCVCIRCVHQVGFWN